MGTQSMKKLDGRRKRHIRVRKKIFGTSERPRLCVFRSSKHIYAQVIDDEAGKTLAAASSSATGEQDTVGKVAGAKEVGRILAGKCVENNIETVIFDRSGYLYHGRVQALADGAREGGLKF